MSFLWHFARDERTLTLMALILIDLVLGIIAALRAGAFDWNSVGLFYRSNVIPYLLGFALVYTISMLGVASLLGVLWGEVAATVGVGPAIVNLGASILRNLATVRTEAR